MEQMVVKVFPEPVAKTNWKEIRFRGPGSWGGALFRFETGLRAQGALIVRFLADAKTRAREEREL
ncbi:MAG: hypothetical protein ACI9R3_001503 [Verrucomicrobiales bacterium]|jgi:hypothetical protein